MSSPVFHAPADDDTDGSVEHRPSDPHLFRRDKNGMVKLKINLSPEEATLIEEAANGTPLMVYVHRVLIDRARFHARRSIRDAALVIDEEP
jgi:hypothetical protein